MSYSVVSMSLLNCVPTSYYLLFSCTFRYICLSIKVKRMQLNQKRNWGSSKTTFLRRSWLTRMDTVVACILPLLPVLLSVSAHHVKFRSWWWWEIQTLQRRAEASVQIWPSWTVHFFFPRLSLPFLWVRWFSSHSRSPLIWHLLPALGW